MLNISSARFASDTVRHDDERLLRDLHRPVDLLHRREVDGPALPARRRVEHRARPTRRARHRGAADPVVDGRDAAAVRIRCALTRRRCEFRHVSLLKMCSERSERDGVGRAPQPYDALQRQDPAVARPERGRRDPALLRAAPRRARRRPRSMPRCRSGGGGRRPPGRRAPRRSASGRPLVAAAPSSASLIVTPSKPSSPRSSDWILGDQGAGFASRAG